MRIFFFFGERSERGKGLSICIGQSDGVWR